MDLADQHSQCARRRGQPVVVARRAADEKFEIAIFIGDQLIGLKRGD